MGDYIDRGPRSKGVVDYVFRLKNQAPPEQIICLKGNHEAMFLNFLQGRDIELFLYNGGLSTLKDYWGEDLGGPGRCWCCPRTTAAFTRNCSSIMKPRIISSSMAASSPGCPLAEQVEEDLLWIRGEFITSQEDFGRRVIFGHTPFKQPLVMPNKIGIDTGAVYGNCLTCLEAARGRSSFSWAATAVTIFESALRQTSLAVGALRHYP